MTQRNVWVLRFIGTQSSDSFFFSFLFTLSELDNSCLWGLLMAQVHQAKTLSWEPHNFFKYFHYLLRTIYEILAQLLSKIQLL